jgi:hypothetical protein
LSAAGATQTRVEVERDVLTCAEVVPRLEPAVVCFGFSANEQHLRRLLNEFVDWSGCGDPNRRPNLLRVANPPTNMCAPQASWVPSYGVNKDRSNLPPSPDGEFQTGAPALTNGTSR